jgi:hypothetical protein
MVDEKRYPIGVLDIYHENHDDIVRTLLEGHGWAFLPPTAVIRRDIALDIGGYREDLTTSMDLDFFLKVCERGRVANVPDILFEYRLRAKSITHARKAGQAERHNMVLSDAYERRNLGRVPQRFTAADAGVRGIEHHLTWGWWALKSGYPRTACRQACLAIMQRPWSVVGWKLAACAIRDILAPHRRANHA